MHVSLLVAAILGILAGCSKDSNDSSVTVAPAGQAGGVHALAGSKLHKSSAIASLPDRGSLMAYDRQSPVIRRGAYTWRPVHLSEARALRAIAEGSMVVNDPAGRPIRLQYDRHVEHADGNWTWIGHPTDGATGTEAVVTFGQNAVFGSIPNGNNEALQVTTAAGKTWLVETHQRLLPASAQGAESDFLMAPSVTESLGAFAHSAPSIPNASGTPQSLGSPSMQASPAVAAAETTAAIPTVDLVIGYTTGFAARLGGQSEALTRLNFLVDVANQAYGNSALTGRLRLVHAIQVNYADNTANRTALLELSGARCTAASGTGAVHLPDSEVNCTPVAVPAALQPLLQARELYRADLVSLVRNFQSPENQSCGVAWLLGGGQQALDANSGRLALSVVSDSAGGECRSETLAHELGHNMGLAHDRASAAGADDTNNDGNPLDPAEYGRFAYSFGYSAPVDAGNFYTIMSLRQGNQTGFRVFSNPRVTTCGGLPCGVTDQADNARTLEQTMPIIASFRTTVPFNTWLRGDFDGDGRDDVLWRNTANGTNAIWRAADSLAPQSVIGVTNQMWVIAGASDFDGDGRADILWHNIANGANVIWKSGNAATPIPVTTTSLAWNIAGAGDFDGDGRSDILWRNGVTGANVIWKSGSSTAPVAVTTVPSQDWKVVGVADFDGDHRADILWRNTSSGANTIWRAGTSALPQAVSWVTNQTWIVAGAGDFDGDEKADILWHNTSSGQNTIWKSANLATPQNVTGVNDQAWIVAGVGDFDGDGKADILWRNVNTGQNTIWKSANLSTPQAMSSVTNLTWSIVG